MAEGEAPTQELEGLCRSIIEKLGEDSEREGLKDTPSRMSKALTYFTSGYSQNLEGVTNGAVFPTDNTQQVVVANVEFYSLCEHHVVPFFGRAHVAFLPNGKTIGLSKVARITDMFARRLQIQEQLTQQICDALEEVLHPRGVAVLLQGTHMCMAMRGVEKCGSSTTTSAFSGSYLTDPALKQEFYSALQLHSASKI